MMHPVQVRLLARAFYSGECPPREPEEEVPAGQRIVRRDKVRSLCPLMAGGVAVGGAARGTKQWGVLHVWTRQQPALAGTQVG